MRSFKVDLSNYLQKGLRPARRNNYESAGKDSLRNQRFLVEAFNCQLGSSGLEPFEPLDPVLSQETFVSYGIDLEWPFPQVFKGKKYTFLLMKERLFFINLEDGSLYELDQFWTTNDISSPTTIAGGLPWQVIDFWGTFVLVNGQDVVFHTGKHDIIGTADKIYRATTPRVNAACGHLGRGWFGGFDLDYGFRSEFKNIIDSYLTSYVDNYNIALLLGNLGQNWVLATNIGRGLIWPFIRAADTHVGVTGEDLSGRSTTYRNLFFEQLMSNEIAFIPMPWQGAVRKLMPLGKYVVVFGDDGVSVLNQARADAIGTVEFKQLGQGINSSTAAGGSLDEIVWLDNSGCLWHLDSQLKLSKLGYEEWFEDMLGTGVVVSYSAARGFWYICNNFKGFVLSRDGLCQIGQLVTSCFDFAGRTYGFGSSVDAMDRTFKLLTDTIDLRERGKKTFSFIELQSDVPEAPQSDGLTVKTGVDWRNSKNDRFKQSRLVSVNREGVSRCSVTASELRVRVEASDFRDFHLDGLSIEFQTPDRRYTRGPYVDTVNS